MDQTLYRPTEDEAAQIAKVVCGEKVVRAQRFPTGLCHYVYDVLLKSGRRVVVRIADESGRSLLAGGVYWSKLLRMRGVPLPAQLYEDLGASRWPFGFVVLERLEGTDLGNVHAQLSPSQKRNLAREIVTIQ